MGNLYRKRYKCFLPIGKESVIYFFHSSSFLGSSWKAPVLEIYSKVSSHLLEYVYIYLTNKPLIYSQCESLDEIHVGG